MARNITITFEDGSSHIYQNAPDTITPDIVQKRAEAQFGKTVSNIDGGNLTTQEQPSIASQIAAPFQRVGRAASNIAGAIVEPALQMATGFAAKPISEIAGMAAAGRELVSPMGGDPEAFKKSIAEQFTYQPSTAAGQYIAQNILAPIGGALESGAEALTKPFSGGSDIAAAGLKESALQGVGFLGVKGAPKVASALEASNAAKLAEIAMKNVQDSTRIDAAKIAVEKYGFSLDPTTSNPTLSNIARVTLAGKDKLLSMIRRENEQKVASILKDDVGIPSNEPLTSTTPFENIRNSAGSSKKQIQTMRGFNDINGTANANIALLQPEELIGGKTASKKVASLIDESNNLLSNPDISGARLISEIENLRKNARGIYKQKDIKPTQRVVADTYIGIANELESMIERNLSQINANDLLNDFLSGRTTMAKSYALQEATNLNTGLVDPMILAKMTSKDNALTGAFADIGKIAGNFPESLGIKPGAPGGMKEFGTTHITRTGLGGTLGYMAGSAFGSPLVGAGIGAASGELLGGMYAKRLAENPAVQRTVSVPSYGTLSVARRIAPEATRAGMLGTAFSPYIKEEQP